MQPCKNGAAGFFGRFRRSDADPRRRPLPSIHNLLLAVIPFLLGWDPEPVELQSSLIAISWGLWALAPWNGLWVCPHLYRIMLYVAPGWAWGLLLLLGGLFQIVCLSQSPRHLNDQYRWLRIWKLRRFAAACAFLTWTCIAIMFALADWRSPSMVFYAILALSGALCCLRLRARLPVWLEQELRQQRPEDTLPP